jgi:transcriptional regulator with XRE-family HTH domain
MSTKKWNELLKQLPPDARARIDARVARTLASMPLSEVRRAIGMTQAELASTLDTGQGSVSKVERSADMYLSTLRKYVEAMGGELHLIASFPEGRRFEIVDLGTTDQRRAR